MKHSFNRLLIALLVIGVGVLFLADNFDLINFNPGELIQAYWPVILLYFGLGWIAEGFSPVLKGDSAHWGKCFSGLLVILLGYNFLAPVLDFPHILWADIWKLWPLLVIWFGIHLLWLPGHKESHRGRKAEGDTSEGIMNEDEKEQLRQWREQRHQHQETEDTTDQGEPLPNMWLLAGEVDQDGRPFTLDNRTIFVGLGSIDLNLTRAVLPDREVTIHANCLLGSINLYLPSHIPVKVTGGVQIGSMDLLGNRTEGLFKRSSTVQTDDFKESAKRLVIHTSNICGEIRVIRV